jgi:hypothetical protein
MADDGLSFSVSGPSQPPKQEASYKPVLSPVLSGKMDEEKVKLAPKMVDSGTQTDLSQEETVSASWWPSLPSWTAATSPDKKVSLFDVRNSLPTFPTWPSSGGEVFRFEGPKRKGLYIDTGAAENLSGDRVLLDHYENVLKPLGDPSLEIEKENYPASFAGINGPALSCSESWGVPGFLGAGTGVSGYKTAVVEDSNLPSLVCLKSIRTKTGVIHSGHDVIYIPDIPTQGLEGLYRKFPLDFDGIHYSMPFDQVSASSKEAPAEMVELKVDSCR